MALGVIFRRIGGRIIPVHIARDGVQIGKRAITRAEYKAFPEVRKVLKEEIAAKTSLTFKRQGALRTVREAITKRVKLGEGTSAEAYLAGNSVVKIAKPRTPTYEMFHRFKMKTFLSKHQLAPETFFVRTGQKEYLIQPRGKVYGEVANDARVRGRGIVDRWARRYDNFKRAVMRRNVWPGDAGPWNVGVFGKKKLKTIDAGMYTFNPGGGQFPYQLTKGGDKLVRPSWNNGPIDYTKLANRMSKFQIEKSFGARMRDLVAMEDEPIITIIKS